MHSFKKVSHGVHLLVESVCMCAPSGASIISNILNLRVVDPAASLVAMAVPHGVVEGSIGHIQNGRSDNSLCSFLGKP